MPALTKLLPVTYIRERKDEKLLQESDRPLNAAAAVSLTIRRKRKEEEEKKKKEEEREDEEGLG
jgi:hypothetical protein